MSRRGLGRRPLMPKPKPFDVALNNLDVMEKRAVEHSMTAEFTPQDFVEWLYPPAVLGPLQEAFPFVRELDQGPDLWEALSVGITDHTILNCSFKLKAKEAKILVPPQKKFVVDTIPVPDKIAKPLHDGWQMHSQFQRVRHVVDWVNQHATLGAARHYCPWLSALLPDEHDFHHVTGGRAFREPRQPMTYELIEDMRAAGGIVGAAILLPAELPVKTILTVGFGPSQQFGIL